MDDAGKKRIFAVILVFAGIGFGTLVAEIVFRMTVPRSQLLSDRDEHFWMARYREQIDDDAALSGDVVYDPHLGWRMRPGFEQDGVRHDERGYRRSAPVRVSEGAEQPEAKPRRRVLIIGASMAYGLGVRDEQTIAGRLAAMTDAEVVNMGVNAHGLDQTLLLFEREGAALKPDEVALIMNGDDFFRSGLRFRDGPKPFFTASPDGYRLAGVPVPSRAALKAEGRPQLPFSLRVADAGRWLLRRSRGQSSEVSADREPALVALNEYLLKRLSDAVKRAGARLTMVTAGHCFYQAHELGREAMLAIAGRLDIFAIDAVALMKGSDYESYYGWNCHWSPKGNALVAERLVPELGLVKH